MNRAVCQLVAITGAILMALTASAWTRDGAPLWTTTVGQVRSLNISLRLGDSPTYSDSSTPNSTATAAARSWNLWLTRLALTPTSSDGSPGADNGINEVAFGTSVYGQSFGSGVLAITITSYTSDARIESDVIVNSAYTWDSYGGFLRANYDLRRVVMHELGHVLGLGHPDTAGQSVSAIMNSRTDFVDYLTVDDISGAAALYGDGNGGIPLPVIRTQPKNTEALEGTYANFYVYATGLDLSYQWRKDGTPIPRATSPTFQFTTRITDGGNYDVVVSNGGGSVISNSATLTIIPATAPAITTQPADTTVAVGTGIELSVAASGSYPMSYQWFKDGVIISGATNSYYRSTATGEADSGSFSVEVKNVAGKALSNNARVVIKPLVAPEEFTIGELTATIGSTIFISIRGYFDSGYSYAWYHNKTLIPGKTARTLQISPATLADEGEYFAVVSNATGSTTSRVTYVSITPDAINNGFSSSQSYGDFAYALFHTPARIERYNLTTHSPGPTITLPFTPTSFTVHRDYVYVTTARALYRISLTTGATDLLLTTETDIRAVVPLGDWLILANDLYNTQITAYKINDGTTKSPGGSPGRWRGTFLGTQKNGFLFATGLSQLPGAFSRAKLSSDGVLIDETVSPVTNYAMGNFLRIDPTEKLLFGQTGVICDASTLTYIKSIPKFIDIAFLEDGRFATLSDTGLIRLYSAELTEISSNAHATGAIGIFASGASLLALTPPLASGLTSSWTEINPDAPTLRTKAAAVEATSITFIPDAILQDREGTLLLLSRAHAQVFRWSPSQRSFLASIGLEGSPNGMAYLAEKNRLYLYYADQHVSEVKLNEASPTERIFRQNEASIVGMAATDAALFLCDDLDYYQLFTPDGSILNRSGPRQQGLRFAWNSSKRRIYHISDNNNPQNLYYTPISEIGIIETSVGSPYGGEIAFSHPIVVSPSGDTVLVGTGAVFNGDTLSKLGSLPVSISAGAWQNDRLYTARTSFEGTQIQRWDKKFSEDSARTINGTPKGLFPLGASQLVAVTMPGKSVAFTVLNADLTVASTDLNVSVSPVRLLGLSSRAVVGGAGAEMIAGFSISGPEPAKLIMRAVGPGLAAYGVGGTNADPKIELRNSANALVAANDDWSLNGTSPLSSIFSSAGLFPLTSGSRDAALQANLEKGNYTAVVSGVGNKTGVTLVEFYALNVRGDPVRLSGISTRATVGTGGDVLIAGLTIDGTEAKRVIIRATGPTLAQYGVAGTLANPLLQLYSGDQKITENDDWGGGSELSTAMASVGLFPLAANSKDSALVVTLDPGSYTAHVKGSDGGTGVALIEVYELP